MTIERLTDNLALALALAVDRPAPNWVGEGLGPWFGLPQLRAERLCLLVFEKLFFSSRRFSLSRDECLVFFRPFSCRRLSSAVDFAPCRQRWIARHPRGGRAKSAPQRPPRSSRNGLNRHSWPAPAGGNSRQCWHRRTTAPMVGVVDERRRNLGPG